MAESAAHTLTYDPMQVEEGEDNQVHVSGDESTERATQHGRKRVRNPDSWKQKHVKKKGLRRNAPQMTIDVMMGKECCKKACVQQLSAEHLLSLRQHFAALTYDQQNLYLTGLMIRRQRSRSQNEEQPYSW